MGSSCAHTGLQGKLANRLQHQVCYFCLLLKGITEPEIALLFPDSFLHGLG